MFRFKKKSMFKRSFFIVVIFILGLPIMANSPPPANVYSSHIQNQTGPIIITIVNAYDFFSEEVDCLPGLEMSSPVHEISVSDSRGQNVAKASCQNSEDCIVELLSWRIDCNIIDVSNNEDWNQDTDMDGGADDSHPTECDTYGTMEFFPTSNNKICNDTFTVAVETVDGETSTMTFSHYWDYSPWDDDWGCSFPY